MLDFANFDVIQTIEDVGTNTSNSEGTDIAASATANSKPTTYTQLIASTAHHATGIMITGGDVTSAATDYLVDIAIGGSGLEEIIFEDLLFCSGTGSVTINDPYYFPVPIPASTRISARMQSTTGSETLALQAHLFSGYSPIFSRSVITMGASTTDSGGTSIDSGATANAEGGFTEIVSSTAEQFKGLVVAIGNQTNSARTSYEWLMDIAIGSASNEEIIVPNLHIWANSVVDCVMPRIFHIPIQIPKGVRLSVQTQCSGTNATDRLLDVILYGIT